jgi:hypothetical protein
MYIKKQTAEEIRRVKICYIHVLNRVLAENCLHYGVVFRNGSSSNIHMYCIL